MMKRATMTLFSLIALISLSTLCHAQSDLAIQSNQHSSTTKLAVSNNQQAIQRVQQQYSGKVLRVQSTGSNGKPGYTVKMLSSDGLIFYIWVDAQTGAITRN